MEQKELSKPTPEQEKRFWEWCGFKYAPLKCDCTICRPNCWIEPNARLFPDSSPIHCTEPDIDPTNLFKYAVPKVVKEYSLFDIEWDYSYDDELWTIDIHYFTRTGNKEEDNYCMLGTGTNEDPALALFWAIYKVAFKEK